MATKKVTKKKATPTKKGAAKKKVSKKTAAKKTKDVKEKDVSKAQASHVPVSISEDGRIVPIDSTFGKLGSSPSPGQIKCVEDPPADFSGDERARVRAERRMEKRKKMDELARKREAANAAAAIGNVASIDEARKRQEAPKEVLRAPTPSIVEPPKPSPPLATNTGKDKQPGHVSVEIPELLKYKLIAKEGAHRAATEPIKQDLKRAAERKLQADIAKALSTDEKCVQTGKELEDCVNEILTTVQPHLPQGYAVVHIAAEDSVAVCKHAPDQAGKKFRLKLG